MIDNLSYLIFELSHSRYAIAADAVQELFFLPEISPVAEAGAAVVGVINLRGEILPVLNLHRQIGRGAPPYQLNDSVVVLQWQGHRFGVIVNQVWEVQPIAIAQISTEPIYGRSEVSAHSLVAGIAIVGETLVTILNLEGLVQYAAMPFVQTNLRESQVNPDPNANENVEVLDSSITENQAIDLYDHLPLEARQTLRARSVNLRQSLDMQDSTGLMPLAVMGLDGEYFGLGLEAVHEFTNIHKVTPVPCAPSHIMGNMNLRGEIVTLVDISRAINLTGNCQKLRQKAIVVRIQELVAGVAVDEIFDVLYLDSSQISPPPVAVHATQEYLQGVAPYRDKMMGIINLEKILTSGALVVNEEV